MLPALEGRDLIARAKTGTGKTLAFGIPILKRLTGDDAQKSTRYCAIYDALVFQTLPYVRLSFDELYLFISCPSGEDACLEFWS